MALSLHGSLSQNRSNYLAVNIGESAIDTIVSNGQSFVIDSEQV